MNTKSADLVPFLRVPPWVLLLAALCPSVSYGQAQGPRFINPHGLVQPNGYTHVVVAPDGRTVYVAGQVALDSTGQVVGSGDFKAQAEQVFRNLNRAIESVGGSLADVIKTTTYVTDFKNVAALREIRGKYLTGGHPPANTLLVVSSLARPELLLEIEAVAVLGQAVRLTHGD
jgi:enamine deaminase RidA (YjgF/YER057c/UK114 family)